MHRWTRAAWCDWVLSMGVINESVELIVEALGVRFDTRSV